MVPILETTVLQTTVSLPPLGRLARYLHNLGR